MRRAVVPVLSVSVAALLLAGCTPAPESGAGECAVTPSGAASDAIRVSGEAGAEPTVEFDAPLSVEETERTVVTAGEGELVEPGSTALLDFSLYNSQTGELATSTGHGGEQSVELAVDEAITIAGLVKTVECAHVGDRIASVVSAADAFGENGFPDFGIAGGDSVVFVVDVVDVVEPAEAREWTEDVPEVEFDDDGVPTVELPDADPPAELLLAVLEAGDGDVVEAGDEVVVDYQGTSWDTGEIFDESFTREPATFPTGGVIEGFTAALVGQTVGSTVLVSIPPAYGYGEDPAAHQLGGQTLVFLIEIQEIAG